MSARTNGLLPDDHAPELENRLILNLRNVGHTMRVLYEGKGSQSQILILLHEIGPVTQRELTERLGVRPGSASEVIRKLEHAGLIVRTPSQSDHRTSDILLTNAGTRQAEEAAARRTVRHQEMFSHLSREEQETLLTLLEKLNADWERRYHTH